jgi:ATP-binding cassette subfamily B protein
VLQSSHIFGGTIADNIRYGKPQSSLEEVQNAARLAGADNFIRDMREGYDHHVGEGGNNLSAGQKQLISFARAILAKPQILVMDEATSSVDTVTEQYIQKGMQQLLDGRISLIIAHRLSTIRNADRILVIENGRIIEQGNHLELLAARGRYYFLYTQQKIDDTVKTEDTWAAS